MMKTAWLMMLSLVMFIGCAEKKEEGATSSSSDQTPVVSVSNYPLQYFVERLAPWIDVQFPAHVSDDPAYWKPNAQDISAMQKADLIVLNGATYETWLANVSLSQAKLVNTAAGLTAQFIPLNGHTTHSHGLEGEHEHSGTAFTLWLDLTLAQAQVQALNNALASKWPNRSAEIKQSTIDLIRDLESLDGQLKAVVSVAADRPVLFSHPVYQYLQNRYGMNGKSVHWEPDALPDEALWKELMELLKNHPAKWMIWEGTPLPAITERLSEMGITSVVFDPCAGKPEQGDFMSVMKQNVSELQKVYGSQ
jgi:zinc transport system substrate-binding protein